MKKKSIIIILILIIMLLLVILGFILGKKDKERVNNNEEPKYTIKIVTNDGSKITYWGLGYKVIRYTGVSPYEPFKSNIGVKFGSWFMNYKLPKNEKSVLEDVLLNIKIDTLKSSGATFVLKNNTDREFWYGPEYEVEKYVEGKWQAIGTLNGEPLVWNTVVDSLNKNEEVEMIIDWSLGYGKLSNGKYRLLKSVIQKDDASVIIKLYAEFEIE